MPIRAAAGQAFAPRNRSYRTLSSDVENHHGTLCPQHSAGRFAQPGMRPLGYRNRHKQGDPGFCSADHISGDPACSQRLRALGPCGGKRGPLRHVARTASSGLARALESRPRLHLEHAWIGCGRPPVSRPCFGPPNRPSSSSRRGFSFRNPSHFDSSPRRLLLLAASFW